MKTHRKRVSKWVHGEMLAVRVEVEQVVEEGDPWSPYLEPGEVARLDAAMDAADSGDEATAARLGRVFRLVEVSPGAGG